MRKGVNASRLYASCGEAAYGRYASKKSQDPRSRKQGRKRGVVGGRQPPT